MAPSDSRKRPDQRLMENGFWDEANEEKLRIEEKQRTARKQREAESELAVQEGMLLYNFPFHHYLFECCHSYHVRVNVSFVKSVLLNQFCNL